MKKRKRILLLLLIFAIIFTCCFFGSKNLKDAMNIFAHTNGNAMLSMDMQNALYEQLSKKSGSYITVTKDSSERITAVQIHSIELSLLASELTVFLLDQLQNYKNDAFGIPLGNLTSSALFSGRGPLIPVKPVVAGNIASELQSTLQNSGINQTLHRVAIHFVMTVQYLSPVHNATDTIAFDIVIAETLIVGEVPIYRD